MDLSFLIKNEEEKLSLFLNQKISLTSPEISKDDLEKFFHFGFDLRYLPTIEITKEKKIVNWQDYPKDNFFKLIEKNKISSKVKNLFGKWVLIDSRPKPKKNCCWLAKDDLGVKLANKLLKTNFKQRCQRNTAQQYENDFLLPILKSNGFSSRFALSWREIKEFVIPSLAQFLKTDSRKIRMPCFVEWNFLGNVFYPQWGTTSTWEWFDDYLLTGECLTGGSNSLSILGWDPPDFWSSQLGFRLLVET